MKEKGIDSHGQNKVKQVGVKYVDIMDGQFPGEVIVTIEAIDRRLTGIFPCSAINTVTGTIAAFIVGEEADRYLVELPMYTFTSGSKAWFPKNLVLATGGP